MVAIVNPYFHKSPLGEQSLLNRIVTESIQVQGRQYYYLPRNSQTRDLILGEDAMSSFDLAVPLEMYMVDAQGFQGQKEMFTKFGLQINNTYRLVVSVDRWNQEVKELFDSGRSSFTVINYMRPHEGDLIYDPLTKFLMAIKFVDHDQEFYSLGKNYVYYLSCEAFMYQNEPINTQVQEIDAFNSLSHDELTFQLLTDVVSNIVGGGLSFGPVSSNPMSSTNIQIDTVTLTQENGDYILNELTPTPTRDTEVDFITPANTINTTITDPFSM